MISCHAPPSVMIFPVPTKPGAPMCYASPNKQKSACPIHRFTVYTRRGGRQAKGRRSQPSRSAQLPSDHTAAGASPPDLARNQARRAMLPVPTDSATCLVQTQPARRPEHNASPSPFQATTSLLSSSRPPTAPAVVGDPLPFRSHHSPLSSVESFAGAAGFAGVTRLDCFSPQCLSVCGAGVTSRADLTARSLGGTIGGGRSDERDGDGDGESRGREGDGGEAVAPGAEEVA